MRLFEFTNAEEQLKLLQLIFDNTFSTIRQQAEQQAREKAEQARLKDFCEMYLAYLMDDGFRISAMLQIYELFICAIENGYFLSNINFHYSQAFYFYFNVSSQPILFTTHF